jgi:transposase, IS5 family
MSHRTSNQLSLMTMTCEALLGADHAYRKLAQVLDLGSIAREFEGLYSDIGAVGIPVEKGIRALIVQSMEDYSDRQMERALAENIAVKWYCGFELGEETPRYTYFTKLRKRLGTKSVARLFQAVVSAFESRGWVSDVFQFVDATAIITKNALWEERDRAIADGLEQLDNQQVGKYAADKDARTGCKGKKKFWFGYKRHPNVDMRSGMVTKVAVTPANQPDGKVMKSVLRQGGMVFADKAYSKGAASRAMRIKGCHSGAIKKRNRKDKNRDLDRWLTRVRMPYEGVFSKCQRRARYRGWAKVQLQAFMEALAHNLKRAIVLSDAVPTPG